VSIDDEPDRRRVVELVVEEDADTMSCGKDDARCDERGRAPGGVVHVEETHARKGGSLATDDRLARAIRRASGAPAADESQQT
jgi:hypothetical protein